MCLTALSLDTVYSISSVPAGWRRSGTRIVQGREYTGVVYPRLIDDRIGLGHREPFHHVFVVVYEISRLIQPGSAIKTGYITTNVSPSQRPCESSVPAAIVLSDGDARQAE